MKVLILSVFHPELVRGGAQQIAWELFEGLKQAPGVAPVLLASTDRSLPALYKAGAGITGFDGRPDEYLFLTNELDPWWHKCSDPRLVEAYAAFLQQIRPDVVHFHHFMTFGAELLTLTRRVLPASRIVFTFHEFLAICAANGHMVRLTDRSLCDHATPVRCHQCFPETPPERFFLRAAYMKSHLAAADVFTTPSRFMQAHFVRWGLPAAKLVHVPNGQDPPPGAGAQQPNRRRQRNRFGFFGQLVDAKGVWLLLQAVELLRAEGFSAFTVEINGDNLRYASDARRAEVERFTEQEAARPRAERIVSFNGSYHRALIAERMARVDWCVVPSVWWENSPVVIQEAFAFGRPVIAANVGGQAELVTDGKEGLLFAFADARALADTLRRAATEPGLWDRLAAGIAPPPGRAAMVERFLALYRANSAAERGQAPCVC
jgi:glycosyltransferase involved in cell wall biosynthesis